MLGPYRWRIPHSTSARKPVILNLLVISYWLLVIGYWLLVFSIFYEMIGGVHRLIALYLWKQR